MKHKKSKNTGTQIAVNRRARHDYFIEEQFEAGLVLEGWEVKSIRANRVQIAESHVIIKNGEAWLLGSHINPLESASSHFFADPRRTRKLLLQKRQIHRLMGAVDQKGYTVVALELYQKQHLFKLSIALAKGKKLYDKRATEKDKDWQREKARALKVKVD